MIEAFKRRLLYRLFRQNWTIGVIPHPVHVVAGLDGVAKQQASLRAISWMTEQRGTFAADPFPIGLGDGPETLRIFYEHFDWRSGKGDIRSVTFSDGSFSGRRLFLDSPYHLSYPFVFDDNGAEPSIIPEHSEAGQVRSYGVDQSGAAVPKLSLISNGKFVDPTIFRHGGRYWMFATEPGEKVNTDLCLLSAPSLTASWQMHAQFPVKSDVTNARPAGQVFCYKGALFRPAQNCARFYGESIKINRITKLTETEFSETQEAEVRPLDGWKYDFGLHTLSSSGAHSVIDAARLESKFAKALDGFAGPLRHKRPVQ